MKFVNHLYKAPNVIKLNPTQIIPKTQLFFLLSSFSLPNKRTPLKATSRSKGRKKGSFLHYIPSINKVCNSFHHWDSFPQRVPSNW